MAGETFLQQLTILRAAHAKVLSRYRRAEDAYIAAEREAQDTPAEPSARKNYDLKRGAFRSAEDDLAEAEQKLQEAIIRYNANLPREPVATTEAKEPNQ